MIESRGIHRTSDQPIFIVGMARSGTTLLSEILNNHSKIAVSPETHYFSKYWADSNKASLKKRTRLSEQFLISDEFKQFGFSDRETDEIAHEIREGLKNGQTEFFTTIMHRFRLKAQKPIWAEKTTAHLMYIPEIAHLIPGGSFISITRDPRDVCLSLKKVPFNPGSSISIARRWRRYVTRTEYYHNRYENRFHEIKYEDLVTDPQPTVKKICDFLGVQFESSMLNRAQMPATFNIDHEYWKMNATRPIDSKNFGKWKNEMSPGEIYFFQKFLAKEMKLYSYEILPIRFTFHFILEILRIFAHWALTVALNIVRRIAGISSYGY